MKLTQRHYVVIGAVGVVVTSLIGLRWYLSSEAFATMLEERLSQDGLYVAFDESLRWSSVFPRVALHIPAVKLSLADQSYRIRVKDIELSIPLSVLLSHEKASQNMITLKIAHAAMIVDQKTEGSDAAKDKSREIDYRASVEQLSQLRGELSLTNGELVHRTDSKSQRTKLTNLHISLDAPSAELTGMVEFGDAVPMLVRSEIVYGIANSNILPLDVSVTLAPVRPASGENEDTRISGNIEVGRDTISFNDIEAVSGSNRASAAFSLTPKNKYLHGTVALKRVEIADVIHPHNQHRKLFPDTPINFGWLADADIDLALSFGAVRYHGVPLITGHTSFSVAEGKALLEGKDLRILGGTGSLEWRAKQLSEQPQFSLQAAADEIDVSRINSFLGDAELFREGNGALRATVGYSGHSPAEHVRSASGTLTLGVTESILAPGLLTWIDQSLVSYGKRATTQQYEEPKELHIPCARAHFALDQGFLGASKSIVAETPDNVIVSSGYADLDSEQLTFTFSSRTKKAIDWSLLSQVKYVQLGGTIREPRLRINQQEAVKKGALLASSFILGPVPSLAYSAIEAAGAHGEEKPRCTPIH